MVRIVNYECEAFYTDLYELTNFTCERRVYFIAKLNLKILLENVNSTISLSLNFANPLHVTKSLQICRKADYKITLYHKPFTPNIIIVFAARAPYHISQQVLL